MGRILIIEDEAAIADTVVYALEREGFACEWVQLGRHGVEAARRDLPELIILDVGLPDGSGFDRCREIRAHSEVPVIFLTARGEEIDRVVGLEIGADDYVVKPFSPRELVARVRTILKRAQATRAPTSQVAGPFELRADEGRVLFGGQTLELTRYEFLLLKTLMARPGRIFSRAQLMDEVWKDAEDSLERTVDAHVKTVRAKIRALDPTCDPIETHRGMGYSFEWPRTRTRGG